MSWWKRDKKEPSRCIRTARNGIYRFENITCKFLKWHSLLEWNDWLAGLNVRRVQLSVWASSTGFIADLVLVGTRTHTELMVTLTDSWNIHSISRNFCVCECACVCTFSGGLCMPVCVCVWELRPSPHLLIHPAPALLLSRKCWQPKSASTTLHGYTWDEDRCILLHSQTVLMTKARSKNSIIYSRVNPRIHL